MPPKEIAAKTSISKSDQEGKGHKTGGKMKSDRTSTGSSTSGAGKAGTSGKGKNKVFTKKKRPLRPIEVLFGEKLVNSSGATMLSKRLSVGHGYIGLYFGAKWCPSCKIMIPQLILLYEEVRKADHNFEIIYVSFDRSQESFQEYFSNMPWWAMNFDDSDQREEMAVKFNVRGIPQFLLIDANNLEVVCKDIRPYMAYDPRGSYFPWIDFTIPTAEEKKAPCASKSKSKEKIIVLSTSTSASNANVASRTNSAKQIKLDIVAKKLSEAVQAQEEESPPFSASP